MPCLLQLADAIEAVASSELAESILSVCDNLDSGSNHFLLQILSRIGYRCPQKTEQLAVRLCQLSCERATESGMLLLSRLRSKSSLMKMTEILKAQTFPSKGARRLAELRILNEYPAEARMPVDEASKLVSLDFLGAVIPAEEIEDYARFVERLLNGKELDKQPATDLDLEVYLPDKRSDCGGIRQPISEEQVQDFRTHGHWKGPQEMADVSPFTGDIQQVADNMSSDWHRAYLRRVDSEPFYSQWVCSDSLRCVGKAAPAFLQKWADDLLESNDRTRARLIFSRAAFYWQLTFALLRVDAARGVRLWRVLNSLSRFVFTHLTIPVRLQELFTSDSGPEIVSLRTEVWDETTSELGLHYIAVAAQSDLDWFQDFLQERVASQSVLERAKAAATLGWLPYSNDNVFALQALERTDRSEFVGRAAARGVAAQRRDQEAQHWFRQFTEAETSSEAAASAKLLLRSSDARTLRWIYDKVTPSDQMSKTKRYLFAMISHNLNHEIKKHQKELRDVFLGYERRRLKGLTHPFLRETGSRF